ncbi:Zinc-ribbon containing domain-containing protein [Ferrimonas sediminum]|uniref:Zinc-ribbon containing domain-containing protein n=1 Tax=Ferrimonas sediminum TaxID=718193 RepID=A0A1G8QL79_9GAMM|nr:zinc ribbon-containing protein [Ferrimonas sediminum]SDJ05125.1 Zinc-ribbon containing domain-containing protein [Ferrimonas sediminum]
MRQEQGQLIERYESLLKEMERRYQQDPDLTLGQLSQVLADSSAYLQLKQRLSESELAMVEQFLRRDLGEFALHAADNVEQPDSLFTLGLENSLWQWLVEITDKSQLEWHELGQDLKHHGTYESGEVVGLGILVCDKCGHEMTFNHPDLLPACPKCDHQLFSRKMLAP